MYVFMDGILNLQSQSQIGHLNYIGSEMNSANLLIKELGTFSIQNIRTTNNILRRVNKIHHFDMQSEESFLAKRFMITNELSGTAVQTSINLVYLPSTRQVNFSRALSDIHSTVANLSNSHIFYLDYQRRMHVFIGQYPFHEEIILKYELFLDDVIQIRFRKLDPNSSDAVDSQKPAQNLPKRKKVKERTIKEAIDAVHQWRELYETVDTKGKRVFTLEGAAQKVGFAKKTLDDYFNQLRHAQYYGFDFTLHQHDKIGVLRRFVKAQSKQTDLLESIMDIESVGIKADIDQIDQYFKGKDQSSDQDDLC